MIWSDHAAKSPWVHYELGLADAFDVPITMVLARGAQAVSPRGLKAEKVVRLGPEAGEIQAALANLDLEKQRLEKSIAEVRALVKKDQAVRGRTSKPMASGAAR